MLTPRPKEIPAWDSLNADQKKVYARMMEVYAATVAQSDYEIGRVLDTLEESGQLDNTLVIYLEGDNGASAEGTMQGTTNELGGKLAPESLEFLVSMIDELGSDRTYNHYPIGWAHAMDTPFQWTKQVASHFGGTRNGLCRQLAEADQGPRGNPLAVPPRHRHRADDPGGRRHPGPADAQRHPAEADGRRQHGLYVRRREGPDAAHDPVFRDRANRGIYHDGWMASTTPLRPPWVVTGAEPDPDDFPWELYNLADDFSQSKDLAKENPKKLLDLQSRFLMEAVKYNVLPIDSSFADRADPALRPSFNVGQTDFTYYPGMIRIPEANSPDVKNKSFHITADVEIPEGGADGVLATQGGRFGGWGLLVLDGKPMFAYAYSNQDGDKYPDQKKSKTRIAGGEKLTPGKHTISFDFVYDGGGIGKGGRGTLSVDGNKVAEGRIEKTAPFRFSLDESFDVGEDTGTPVIDEYDAKMPFKFSGTLKKVEVKLDADQLTPQKRGELERLKSDFALRMQ